MDLRTHYNRLYEKSAAAILAGNAVLDDRIDAVSDTRYGITLLIRPSSRNKQQIQDFLEELRAIEPDQYYYPDSDLHLTVISIISCYEGFDLARIKVQDYIDTVQQSLTGIQRFGIQLQGITASDAAVMVQGFPADNMLHNLRDQLRTRFRSSGLQESIDSRYAISTAHATVLRFRRPLLERKAFVSVLEKYRQHDFGLLEAGQLELVHNDWYQRERFVRKLHTFHVS